MSVKSFESLEEENDVLEEENNAADEEVRKDYHSRLIDMYNKYCERIKYTNPCNVLNYDEFLEVVEKVLNCIEVSCDINDDAGNVTCYIKVTGVNFNTLIENNPYYNKADVLISAMKIKAFASLERISTYVGNRNLRADDCKESENEGEVCALNILWLNIMLQFNDVIIDNDIISDCALIDYSTFLDKMNFFTSSSKIITKGPYIHLNLVNSSISGIVFQNVQTLTMKDSSMIIGFNGVSGTTVKSITLEHSQLQYIGELFFEKEGNTSYNDYILYTSKAFNIDMLFTSEEEIGTIRSYCKGKVILGTPNYGLTHIDLVLEKGSTVYSVNKDLKIQGYLSGQGIYKSCSMGKKWFSPLPATYTTCNAAAYIHLAPFVFDEHDITDTLFDHSKRIISSYVDFYLKKRQSQVLNEYTYYVTKLIENKLKDEKDELVKYYGQMYLEMLSNIEDVRNDECF